MRTQKIYTYFYFLLIFLTHSRFLVLLLARGKPSARVIFFCEKLKGVRDTSEGCITRSPPHYGLEISLRDADWYVD